ncbi:major facilitator transporter [Nocardioides sp. CF8]|uniref:MFS transporter n=1 Tax=Nocardioides sp. CF8 TaxID=110319 RepID=UPI00032E30A5|nr:MFS transporter [Nocardioides sp. CF8]EON25714.1 major facilitator transporter [Nocardioides sp. CF8]
MTEPDSRHAWRTAGLGFVAMFVTIGVGFSYGVLVLPAAQDLSTSPGVVSGVSGVTVMVFFLIGAPAGMLADRIGARTVLLLGAAALSAGLLLTAAATRVWMLYVGHGLLVGAAMSASFIPLTAVVSAIFVRHRALGVGVAVSGIGVGTLVMAPLLAAFIETVGWRTTYLALSVVAPTVLVACALLLRRPPRQGRAAASLGSMLRSLDHRLMYLSQALLSVAIFMPFAHLPAYAVSVGVGPVQAAGLVGILGAASVVGRLALGPMANRVGLLPVYRACFVAIGASFVFWLWPEVGYLALVLHAVVLGVGYGGFVSLLPLVVALRFGTERLGGLLGVLYTSHVLGAGLGPLATGLLVDRWGYLPSGCAGLACGLGAAVVLGRLAPSLAPRVTGVQDNPSRR